MQLVVKKIINEDKSLHHYDHDDISFCCKEIEKYWQEGLSSNADGKVILLLYERWSDNGGSHFPINFCPLCGTKIETTTGKTFIRKKECKEVIRKEIVCKYKLEELKENE